jgi:hypothetical protein
MYRCRTRDKFVIDVVIDGQRTFARMDSPAVRRAGTVRIPLCTMTTSQKYDTKGKLLSITSVCRKGEWIRVYTYAVVKKATKVQSGRKREVRIMKNKFEARAYGRPEYMDAADAFFEIPASCPPELRARIMKAREEHIALPTLPKNEWTEDARRRLKLAEVSL